MRRDYDRATGNNPSQVANPRHGEVVGPDGTYYRPAPDNRGYRPNEYRAWHRGERLPPEYNSRYYVVDDWHGHHLNRPPAGYHWVQSGGDYLLVAIATGIIASVILSH
jgi:Ni/Co efflux regulator RcnB